jgi:hypothetical protein
MKCSGSSPWPVGEFGLDEIALKKLRRRARNIVSRRRPVAGPLKSPARPSLEKNFMTDAVAGERGTPVEIGIDQDRCRSRAWRMSA